MPPPAPMQNLPAPSQAVAPHQLEPPQPAQHQVNIDNPNAHTKMVLNQAAFEIGQEAQYREQTEADKKRILQMELQKQMDAAKAKKEEEARKRKMEEEREEARLKKEREELEQQFKREEESKKKKLDDVR